MSDQSSLQGTWVINFLEVEGTSIDARTFTGATISISANRFTTAGMGSEYCGRLELNEQASPKTLAMHFESGPESGNINHGIYELGEAQWIICLCMTGGPAPSSFTTVAGSGHVLERLTRVGLL